MGKMKNLLTLTVNLETLSWPLDAIFRLGERNTLHINIRPQTRSHLFLLAIRAKPRFGLEDTMAPLEASGRISLLFLRKLLFSVFSF